MASCSLGAPGGEIEAHLFEGEGHGFFNYRGDDGGDERLNWRFAFAKTVEIMSGFIDRHMKGDSGAR